MNYAFQAVVITTTPAGTHAEVGMACTEDKAMEFIKAEADAWVAGMKAQQIEINDWSLYHNGPLWLNTIRANYKFIAAIRRVKVAITLV